MIKLDQYFNLQYSRDAKTGLTFSKDLKKKKKNIYIYIYISIYLYIYKYWNQGKKLHFHDESVVFFPTSNIYITLYFNVSSTLLRKNRNTDFLYIYIYIYIYIYSVTQPYSLLGDMLHEATPQIKGKNSIYKMQPTKTLRDFLISWYVTSYMLFFRVTYYSSR